MTADANPALPRVPCQITTLGLGGSQLGSMFQRVDDESAQQTLAAAYDAGIRYFDTSPFYGRGLSEERFGRFLRERPRDEFALSTKVGRLLSPGGQPFRRGPGMVGASPNDCRFDYSYDGILRSHADSLARMGMDRIDWLLIHDLDATMHPDPESLERHFAELVGGGFRALEELRTAGQIRGVGAGLNVAGMTRRLVEHCDLDMVLLASSYNLLDRDALADDLPLCVERDIAVVIGAPFCSGLLATGAGGSSTYRYAAVDDATRARVQRIESVCARHAVPLRAAALQFPLRHENVVSVLPGMLDSDQVADNLTMLDHPISDSFWADLDR